MNFPVLLDWRNHPRALILAISGITGIVTAGFAVGSGQQNAIFFLVGIAAITVIILAWPSSPLVIFYPLVWIFWSYYIPFIGGQPERLIGLAGIVGLVLVEWRSRDRPPALPSLVTVGFFALLMSYLAAWLLHSELMQAGEYVASLVARVVLLYLAFFHLRTRHQLRWAVILYIAAGLVAAAIVLCISLIYGFGFLRLPDQYSAVLKALGPFWRTVILSTTEDGAPALLLLGLYPLARNRRQKLGILGGVLFLFSMAFASQYRREILISVPLLLLGLIIDRDSRIRRPAAALLLAIVTVTALVLVPYSAVFRDRLQNETQLVLNGDELRLVSLRAGLQAMARSPLLGYGPSSYNQAIVPFIDRPVPLTLAAFNGFVGIAVESGLCGLVGLLVVFCGVFRDAQLARRRATNIEGVILRCAPVLLLQIVLWFSFGNAIELSMPWFLMGMILAAVRVAHETPSIELT